MSESGAPASTRAAETASVRGVAFGCAKVAVSITMPAISAVASARFRRRAGCRAGRRQQRDHLAGRRGVRLDPVGFGQRLVRGVVVDDDARQAVEQLAMALADGPDAIEAWRNRRRRAGRSRRPGPGPSGTVRRRRGSRTCGGTGSVQTGSAVPPNPSMMRTTPSVAPTVSASGFSWPTASTRSAVRIRSTTTSGTAPR